MTGEHGVSGEHDVSGEDHVTGEIRAILAGLTGDSRPLDAPLGTPLLRDGIGLDSLGGTMLLTEIMRRYGVDVADEDLNLDSLASIGALAAFVSARVARLDRADGERSRQARCATSNRRITRSA